MPDTMHLVDPARRSMPEMWPTVALSAETLSPTRIMRGTLDLFVEEDIDDARHLIRAGVPTEPHLLPGGFHGLDIFRLSAASGAAQAARVPALTCGLT